MTKIRFVLTFCIAMIGNPALAEFQGLLDEFREEYGVIGMGLGVLQGGGAAGIFVSGARENKMPEPLQVSDKWHVGSITKSMTAMVLGSFIDDGLISLDDKLPELLPHITDMHSDWAEITLRELLEHRAGLTTNFGPRAMLVDARVEGLRREIRADALGVILSKPANERQFRYSNVGYTLIGHILETAGDEVWEQLVRERLFEPLNLTTAGFGAPKGEGRYDQPVGHTNVFGFFSKGSNPFDGPADNSPLIGPAGTVHMDIADLLEYGQALMRLQQGHDGIVSGEVFNALTAGREGQYAAGLIYTEHEWAGGSYFWHNGSNTMWYVLMVVMPARDSVIVITANEYSAKYLDVFWKLISQTVAELD